MGGNQLLPLRKVRVQRGARVAGVVWTEGRAQPGCLPHQGWPQSLEVQTLLPRPQRGWGSLADSFDLINM